jgi:hypothetical protein
MSDYKIAKIENDPHVVVNEDARTPTLVRLTEYRGVLKIDFRQIWSPDDNEHFVFTKKGAGFPVEDLREVIEFLLDAQDFLKGREEDDGE